MPMFDGIVLYGLTPDFQRAMRVAMALFAAIYLVYPITLAIAWFAWRKERRGLAKALVLALIVLGLGVPLVDQAKHAMDGRAILAAEVRADGLEVEGEHVVIVRRVCADLCKWLLRYGEVDRVSLVKATGEQRDEFATTGVFPEETEAFDVVLDGLRTVETPIPLDRIVTGEVLVIRREPGGFSKHMPSHMPRGVAPRNIRISTFVAPANWGQPLDNLSPTILTLIHSDQAFLLPLHPFARTDHPGADFEDEGRYLSDLLCPWPHGRLGRVCHENAKP